MWLRLYVDEDAMARALVTGLRARGVDVTTVLDEGMTGQDDVAQLEYAAERGRVLYTFNVGHFCRLHAEVLAQSRSHAGIIVVYRQRYAVGEQLRRLLALVNLRSAEEMRGCLHFIFEVAV
ncbi:MAG: DUF5615 family PIN-like protein [Deinococcota bacterium]|jgi:hypothetical protein|nr:DUF5615 family PIN-like protein [Deinococcota bacterium]